MSSNDANDGAPTYKVGRGRPPLHTRFKKGQSGNPGGRKSGCRNIKALMHEAMSQEVTISLGGEQKRIVMPLALIFAQGQAGLKGNQRAVESLLNRYERLGIGEDVGRSDDLSSEDREILERARHRMAATGGQALAEPSDNETEVDHV